MGLDRPNLLLRLQAVILTSRIDPMYQTLFSHSRCFTSRLQGNQMTVHLLALSMITRTTRPKFRTDSSRAHTLLLIWTILVAVS